MTTATERLQQERKMWRKDHPAGFIAHPCKMPNGDLNLFCWHCLIPGRDNSPWSGAFYPLILIFPAEYPARPPKAQFCPPLPHVNVFPSGTVCISILHENEAGGWKPSINLRQIMLGIQDLLDAPNPESPANEPAYLDYTKNRKKYEATINSFKQKFKSNTLPDNLPIFS